MSRTSGSNVFAGDSSLRRLLSSGAGSELVEASDLFGALTDDLILIILTKLSSSASCPADFISALITCKRLNSLGTDSKVLSKASVKVFAIKADNWSESAERFLQLCVDSQNIEAFYVLGMIRFYCLKQIYSGARLLFDAACNSHAVASYSLFIIAFNGSGGLKGYKDLEESLILCKKAGMLGHTDAFVELGHCYIDGYSVTKDVAFGQRLLLLANNRELAAALSIDPTELTEDNVRGLGGKMPERKVHRVHRFLTEWFAGRGSRLEPGLRLCANSGCGRPETYLLEFQRRSARRFIANYCSHACQSWDRKQRHNTECSPLLAPPAEVLVENLGENVNVNGNAVGDGNGNDAPPAEGLGEEIGENEVVCDVNIDGNVVGDGNGDDAAPALLGEELGENE